MKESNPLTLNVQKLEVPSFFLIILDFSSKFHSTSSRPAFGLLQNFIAEIFQCKKFSNQKLNL